MPMHFREGDDAPRRLDPTQDRPSRTKRKKAAEALQKTGEQLIALSDAQLDLLDIPAELKEAVIDARAMTRHGARRRQLQFIGTLMRSVDGPSIERQLGVLAQQRSSEVRRFKQVELWRDELKSGSDERLAWLMGQFPDMDRDTLIGLVSDTKQSNPAAARKAARELFKFLRRFAEKS